MVETLRSDISQQRVNNLAGGKDFKFMGILQIHYLITDVISCLHDIYQRMACIPQWPVGCTQLFDTKLGGNLAINLTLGTEKAEFTFFSGQWRVIGILDNRGQHRICHRKATLATAIETMSQRPERIGITLKVYQVIPLFTCQQVLKYLPPALAEESRYGLFSRMSKRWISQVMSQTAGSNDVSQVIKQRRHNPAGIALLQSGGNLIGKRFTYTCNLQRVCQPVMNKYTSRQRKYLGFIL